MNYEEAIEYIHGIYWRGSKLGLSRTKELLELLGNPQKDLKFVHVAGTNGKGSTCAMLSSVFMRCGYRTGLYISPYIRRFNERIQFDGEPITDAELAEVTTHVSASAEAMKDKPTEFELVTAIGMEYFKRKRCEIVILETGLGGTLDSTNIIDTPEAAVITAIDYDHMRDLGDTIEQIASAKAGIIKPGGDVIFYGNNKAAEQVIEKRCAEQNAALTVTDFRSLNVKSSTIEGSVFDYTVDGAVYQNLFLPLPGVYQVYNAALVLTALSVLSRKFQIPPEAVRDGLAVVKWPGRFELLRKHPIFIADGAHNPHGIKGTAESLARHFPGKKIIAVIGVMADKDVDTMLDLFLPLVKQAYAVRPDNPRALAPEVLADKIRSRGVPAECCQTPGDGVRAALASAAQDDVLCAVGSFYMYGEIADAVERTVPR